MIITEEGYNNRANLILLWKSKAEDLAKSALALAEINEQKGYPVHHRTPLLLMGMSLEALIKGYLICKEEIQITNGQLPKELKTHSLLDLFKKAKVSVNKEYEEKIFLQRLSEQVEWMGRYPVPTNGNILKNTRHGSQKSWIQNVNDKTFFIDLYNKVNEKY